MDKLASRHQALLDAVEHCFRQRGIDKTTLADVATEAGVSRQTVYRYFGDRAGLFRQVVLRNIQRLWELIGQQSFCDEDLAARLADVLVYCIGEFPGDRSRELLLQLNALDSGMAIALSDDGLAPAMAVLQPWVTAAEQAGQLRPGIDAMLTAEWLYRLIYSYVSLPSPRLQTRDELHGWLREVAVAGLLQSVEKPR